MARPLTVHCQKCRNVKSEEFFVLPVGISVLRTAILQYARRAMKPGHSVQLEEFQRRHSTGVVTLLFTDIVGSGKIKQSLGDSAGCWLGVVFMDSPQIRTQAMTVAFEP